MDSKFVTMAARLSSIGFLGSGKMATAMARGFISAGEQLQYGPVVYSLIISVRLILLLLLDEKANKQGYY